MDKGFIKLHRKILDNPIMEKPEFVAIWLYILLNTAYENKPIILERKKSHIPRGFLLTSKTKIADHFKLPRTNVIRILNYFESEGMIKTKSTNKYTLIEVINWGKYQDRRTSKNTPEGTDNIELNEMHKIENSEKWTSKSEKVDTYKNKDKDIKNKDIEDSNPILGLPDAENSLYQYPKSLENRPINEKTDSSKSKTLIDEIYDDFKDTFKQLREHEYSDTYPQDAKDRRAIKWLMNLFYDYEKKEKNGAPSRPETRKYFQGFWKDCFSVPDDFIVSNISPAMIACKINQINIMINGRKGSSENLDWLLQGT